ncbi:MAG: hypothetical protein NZ561_13350 [Phycisphaerae bacterium]|nr:hypothetical protein [Phycisphaerae bacterium]
MNIAFQRTALDALEPRRLLSAGDLDFSFSEDGKQVLDLPGMTNEMAHAATVLSDGKIVVAGRAQVGSELDFMVARLLPNGDIDTSFGGGDGVTTIDLQVNDEALDIAIAGNGRIVVVGTSSSGSGANTRQFAVARFLANGAVDPTFSGDGKTLIDWGVNADAQAVALSGSGIYVGGYKDLGATGQFALARLLSNGSLDTTYSTDGKVFFGFGGNNDSRCYDIALDPDDRVVMVGYDRNLSSPATGRNFAYAVVGTNALLDPAFSGDGLAVTDFSSGNDEARAVGIDPEFRIVVGGFSDGAVNNDFVATRLTLTGSLDSSFNGDGRFVADLGGVEAVDDLVIHPDGDITLVGQTSAGAFRAGLVRIAGGSGNLSTTFGDGGDGIQLIDFGVIDDGFAVALDPRDLRTVVAGTDGSGKLAVGRVHDLIDQNFPNSNGVVTQMHRLPDGKMLVVSAGVVKRLNIDGTLDTTFPNNLPGFRFGVDSQGRILTLDNGPGLTIVVRRFRADGAPDNTFSGDGAFDFAFGAGNSVPKDLAVDSSDRAVIVGWRYLLSPGTDGGDPAIARITAFGTLDASFDGDGINVLSATGGRLHRILDVAITPDGKSVMAGERFNPLTLDSDAQLYRFNSNGNLDASFGALGSVELNFGTVSTVDVAESLAFDAAGRILVGGRTQDVILSTATPTNGFVARLTLSGAQDNTFDGDGVKIFAQKDLSRIDSVRQLQVLADGTILAFVRGDDPDPDDPLKDRTGLRKLIPGSTVVGDPTFDGDGFWVAPPSMKLAESFLLDSAIYLGAGARIVRLNIDPCIVGFDFLFETQPLKLEVKFNDDVGDSLASTDLVIRRVANPPAPAIPQSQYSVESFNRASNTAIFAFTNGFIPVDGNYTVTFSNTGITNRQNMQLAGDLVQDFFFLQGDANRDRRVDIADFAILAGRFNQPGTFSQGNFNYSGNVDIADFSILANQFNKSLPAPGDLPRPVRPGQAPTLFSSRADTELDRLQRQPLRIEELL